MLTGRLITYWSVIILVSTVPAYSWRDVGICTTFHSWRCAQCSYWVTETISYAWGGILLPVFTVILGPLQETNLIMMFVTLKTDRDDGPVKHHSQKARWVVQWSPVSTKRKSTTSSTPALTCVYVCDELLLMIDDARLFVWLSVNYSS